MFMRNGILKNRVEINRRSCREVSRLRWTRSALLPLSLSLFVNGKKKGKNSPSKIL